MDDIISEIKKGRFAPCYVLYGTAFHLKERLVEEIRRCWLEGEADWNMYRYGLDETPIQELIEEAQTVPFIGEKKLLVGSRAAFFTGQTVKKTEPRHDPDVLIEYLRDPAPFSCLVLLVEAEKLDERKKITKTVRQLGRAVEIAPLKGDALRNWVRKQAEERDLDLSPPLLERLVLRIGEDEGRIVRELDKLALYFGEKGIITDEAIDRLVPRTTEENVFAITRQLGKGDYGGALKVLRDLFQNNEEPLVILSLIVRQVRLIMQVKWLAGSGYSHQQMAQELKVHPYAVKVAAEEGKRVTEKLLHQWLKQLAVCDEAIKTGQMDKFFALEWVIMQMRSARPTAAESAS